MAVVPKLPRYQTLIQGLDLLNSLIRATLLGSKKIIPVLRDIVPLTAQKQILAIIGSECEEDISLLKEANTFILDYYEKLKLSGGDPF
jgi:hypothetical protein